MIDYRGLTLVSSLRHLGNTEIEMLHWVGDVGTQFTRRLAPNFTPFALERNFLSPLFSSLASLYSSTPGSVISIHSDKSLKK